MTKNPHFETASSWKAARAKLTFQPREPGYTVGLPLHSIRIHVRDHKLPEILINDRTLETHYGGFVLSQTRKGADEARRLALGVRHGSAGQEGQIAGHTARIYELGPEPAPDDIDGRTPAVVTWYDADLFFLVARDTMSSHELVRIAISLFGRGRIKRAAGGS